MRQCALTSQTLGSCAVAHSVCYAALQILPIALSSNPKSITVPCPLLHLFSFQKSKHAFHDTRGFLTLLWSLSPSHHSAAYQPLFLSMLTFWDLDSVSFSLCISLPPGAAGVLWFFFQALKWSPSFLLGPLLNYFINKTKNSKKQFQFMR